ncbi:MAG: nucleotidyltransferase family protein [Kiloniellaceae bacterium]
MRPEQISRTLKAHRAALEALGVRSLAIFGSTARGEAAPDSDIDLLVEFDPGTRVGLIRYIGLQNHLSELLGRKVDLISRDAMDRHVRDRVNAEARQVF